MKKHVLIYSLFLIIFFFIGIIKGVLNIPDSIFWKVYWTLGVIFIIGCCMLYMIWYQHMMKKINKLLPLLEKDKNPDLYILENEKLLKELQSKITSSIIHINISVAYCRKKDYIKAKEELLLVNKKSMRGPHKVIYLIDLAYVYFYLDEPRKALDYVNANEKGLKTYENSSALGPVISTIRIFEALSKDNKEKAFALLEESKIKWQNPSVQEDFIFFEKKLTAM